LLATLLVLVRILRILVHRLLPWVQPGTQRRESAIVPPAIQTRSGYRQRRESNFRQPRAARLVQGKTASAHTRL
jgi:hypothetical protein